MTLNGGKELVSCLKELRLRGLKALWSGLTPAVAVIGLVCVGQRWPLGSGDGKMCSPEGSFAVSGHYLGLNDLGSGCLLGWSCEHNGGVLADACP